MSPLRWLSVCCFVVCGWCAGDSFHQQAQAHLEALRKTLDLLETLHQQILKTVWLSVCLIEIQRDCKPLLL